MYETLRRYSNSSFIYKIKVNFTSAKKLLLKNVNMDSSLSRPKKLHNVFYVLLSVYNVFYVLRSVYHVFYVLQSVYNVFYVLRSEYHIF